MNKLSFILETTEGKTVIKSQLYEPRGFYIDNLIEGFYTLLCVDVGIDSYILDEYLKAFCTPPVVELAEEDFPLITNSEEMLLEINANPGFREFMYDLYKENLEVE